MASSKGTKMTLKFSRVQTGFFYRERAKMQKKSVGHTLQRGQEVAAIPWLLTHMFLNTASNVPDNQNRSMGRLADINGLVLRLY